MGETSDYKYMCTDDTLDLNKEPLPVVTPELQNLTRRVAEECRSGKFRKDKNDA